MVVKILQWNARGLAAHYQELRQLMTTHGLDVACIQETFLKEHNSCNIPGYYCVRQDRNEPRGGLAIFIREGIKYTVHDPPTDLECQAVNINTTVGQINVINVYLAPGHDVTPTSTQLDHLFQFSNAIIVGDMNARNQLWGADSDDRRGQLLEQAMFYDVYLMVLTNCWHFLLSYLVSHC